MSALPSSPSTDRGRATRERILEAAGELFYRQGVTATGLDQVITASRTGKGQLYHYFAGKRELVHAVIERQIEAVLAYPIPTDPRSWAEDLIAAYEQPDHPLRCPLGALAAELAEGDPQARAALDRGFSRWTEVLAATLTATDGAHTLATALLAAYQGGLVLAQARGDVGPLRAALEVTLAGVQSWGCSRLKD